MFASGVNEFKRPHASGDTGRAMSRETVEVVRRAFEALNTISGGRIVRFDMYVSRSEALEAVGLTE